MPVAWDLVESVPTSPEIRFALFAGAGLYRRLERSAVAGPFVYGSTTLTLPLTAVSLENEDEPHMVMSSMMEDGGDEWTVARACLVLSIKFWCPLETSMVWLPRMFPPRCCTHCSDRFAACEVAIMRRLSLRLFALTPHDAPQFSPGEDPLAPPPPLA